MRAARRRPRHASDTAGIIIKNVGAGIHRKSPRASPWGPSRASVLRVYGLTTKRIRLVWGSQLYGNIVWGGAGRGQNRFYGAHGVAMAPCPVARVCNINIYIKILQSSYCARVVRAPRTPYPASRPIYCPVDRATRQNYELQIRKNIHGEIVFRSLSPK